MARIRTVKPEFWASEQVMELTIPARLLFIGLWNFSDDRGVHAASTKRLKAEVFPSDDITSEGVAELVAELIRRCLLGEFEADGQRYWHVTGWHKHQKIDKPTYRHPAPPDSTIRRRALDEPSMSDGRAVGEHSANGSGVLDEPSPPEWKGMEGNGREWRGKEWRGREERDWR